VSLPCKAPGDFWFPPVQLGPDAVPGGQRCSPECGTCVASSWPASVAKKKFSGWLGATRSSRDGSGFMDGNLVKFRQELIAGCGTTS